MNKNTAPIPVTILTGFLGSGKTSFLNKILASAEMAQALVLVNEFGEIGLDHLLIESAEDAIIELSNGCLCCTIRGDLIEKLGDIVTRIEAGQLKKPSHLIIETTGLADPVPILQIFIAHPLLLQSFSMEGLIVVVDAVNGRETLKNYQEARRQVALADKIMLSKTDLLPDGQALRPLISQLKTLNKVAEIHTLQEDQEIKASLLQGSLLNSTKLENFDEHEKEEEHDHHHEHHHHHHHDKNRHSESIHSFCLETDRLLPIASIEAFLGILRDNYGAQILRLKGLVATQERHDASLIVHAAQGLFHPPLWLPNGRAQNETSPARQTRLVVIVDGVKRQEIEALFGSFTGQIGLGMADAQALSDNPLAITGLNFSPSMRQ